MRNLKFYLAHVLIFLQFSYGCAGGLSIGGQAQTGFEDLTDQESNLFSEGPISAPVTIAKMDSPNPQFIRVYFTAEDESLDGSFLVEGAAGAVPAEVTKVIVFNSRTTDQEIIVVNEDGSFEATLPGQQSDSVLVASLSDAEDQMSPFYEYDDTDGDGFYVVVETNSTETIAVETALFVDSTGYAYFSIFDSTTNTYDLWRRRSDGTFPQLIAADSSIKFRQIQSTDGEMIYVKMEDGGIFLYTRLDEESEEEGSSPVFSVVELGNKEGGEIAPITSMQEKQIIVKDDSSGVFEITARNEAFPERDYLLRFLPADGSEPIKMIYGFVDVPPFDAYRIVVAKASGDRLFVFAKETDLPGTYSLYELDITDPADYATAWDNRTLLLADVDFHVNYAQADDSGRIFVSVGIESRPESPELIYKIIEGAVLQTISNMDDLSLNVSSKFAITPTGDAILTCDYGDTGEEPYSLLYYHFSYPADNFVHLTESTSFGSCTDHEQSYFIDSSRNVHYHRRDVDTLNIQKAFLDLNVFDELGL